MNYMKTKKDFNFLVFVVIALLVTIPACTNYDDDISSLKTEINEVKSQIEAINSVIEGGGTITSVTPTLNGLNITLSNNSVYTIPNGPTGSEGPAGAPGAPGTVVSIGENGNWFFDDVDTGKPSRGIDGTIGAYFVPNPDGFWHKIEGETEEKTDQSWLPEGTITAIFKDGIVTLYNVKGSTEPITIGMASLSYLTIIPDYVTENNSAIINFAPLISDCGEISPITRARYQVNPSNASINLINTENIYFKYNNPKTKSSELNPKASFVSLVDGILTVDVEVDINKIEKDTSGKIDQIMLMVPLNNGGEVNSDWAQVMTSPVSQDNLALVANSKTDSLAEWSSMELTKTVLETQSLLKTDLRVIDMQYGGMINMKDFVKTMFTEDEWSDFNIDTYDLNLEIDLNDLEGNVIANESTTEVDQQQYVNIEGTIVTGLVYEIDGPDPVNVDRNPIIHVMLKHTDSDCIILEGFVKLNFIESDVINVPPVIYNIENVTADCGEFFVLIDSDQMNESFYIQSKMSKESFHNNYKWDVKNEGVGIITEVPDTEAPDSFNLIWTVSENDLWNNLGKTITKSGEYVYGESIIEVTFSANIIQPTADFSELLQQGIWYENNSYVKHNILEPQLNINSLFKTTTEKLLDLKAVGDKYEDYSYEYIFDPVQPITTVDGITVKVNNEGKQLLANSGGGDEAILTILPQEEGKGDILEFNQESGLAMTLLNKEQEFLKAAIKLVLYNECERPIMVDAFNGKDQFLIHFEGASAPVDGVIYVVPNGTGAGTSWDDGMGDILAAIAQATEENEVWVMGGSFEIEETLVAKNGVNIYGSFTGNESNVQERALMTNGNPWDFTNPTILDGQNQRRIIQTTSDITNHTIVDGFTFINGNGISSNNLADNTGGAIYIESDFAIYQNCIVRNNTVSSSGGGIAIAGGYVINSLIEQNSSLNEAGAIYINTPAGSTSNIVSCVVRGNTTDKYGTLIVNGDGTFKIENSKIYSNIASRFSIFDATSNNIEMFNNLLYNNENLEAGRASCGINGGKFYNNSFAYNIGQVQFIDVSFPTEFINNIYYGNKQSIGGNQASMGAGRQTPNNLIFHNNVNFWTNEQLLTSRLGAGTDVQNNIAVPEVEKHPPFTINSPEFVRPPSFIGAAKNELEMMELINIDLNISSASPCKDTGKTIESIVNDIDGTPRPQGEAFDIGAYETIK